MLLEVESREPVENPTDEDIAHAFATFDGQRTTFATLSYEDERYLQASGGPEEGYDIEYRDGCAEEHYANSGGPVPLERVVQAFKQYARGETTWWRDFEWEPFDAQEEAPQSSGCLGAIVTGIFVALGLALALLLLA